MKTYKKKPTKLLQIRLSEQEYTEIVNFIKKFGVTRREWILSVQNELCDMNIIRQGHFWYNHQSYAYTISKSWDKEITKESVCELCGGGKPKFITGDSTSETLERHHHDGYDGRNAIKTHILCRKCHGLVSRKVNRVLPWEEVLRKFKY